jgi:hypothetical protein
MWNHSLLDNGARPSGIIKFKEDPGIDAMNRLKEHFKNNIQGSSNAGELPVLTDDAEWQQIDNNPRDMDYISTMKETAKYVASALGVPLPLIDNDASTFNNLMLCLLWRLIYQYHRNEASLQGLQSMGSFCAQIYAHDLAFYLDGYQTSAFYHHPQISCHSLIKLYALRLNDKQAQAPDNLNYCRGL